MQTTTTLHQFCKTAFAVVFSVLLLNAKQQVQAQTGCTIIQSGCPADINTCATTEVGGVLGANVTWTPPTFSLSCNGNPGSGYAFNMSFDLPESQSAANCWKYNHVQRIGTGGGSLRLWQSSGTGDPYVITPTFYLTGATNIQLKINSAVGQNYSIRTYLIQGTDTTTISPDVSVTGTGNLLPYNYTITPPAPGAYQIKFEFINNANSSNQNYIDEININAVVVAGCSGDVNFVTTTNYNPGTFFTVGTTTVAYYAVCNSCVPVIRDSCKFNVTVNGVSASITGTTPTNCGLANGSVSFSRMVSAYTSNADSLQYSLNGGAWTTISAPFTINNLAGGDYTLNVRYYFDNTSGYCTILTPLNFSIATGADITAPVITSCGNNLTANANGSCMAAVPNFTGAVTATDECTATGSLVITQSPTAGTMVGLGVTTVTITVTDAAGNSTPCTRTFTVSDATAPTITSCGNNLTANANGSCMAAVPNFTGAVTATDNCTAPGSLGITQTPTAGTMVGLGVTTVTITVTDAAGNSSTCTRTFTVSDATAPTITSCGSNLTANANGSCMAAVPNFVSAVTATDNCTASGSLVITQSPTAGTMVGTGVTTVTITVTDAAGNSSTCTRTFTVSDATAPTITSCGNNLTANANGSCMAAVPNFTGAVTATDNCTASGSLVITQSPTAGTMVGLGVTTVTITVTDAAGNSSTCTRTFTVSDATAPTITSCGNNLTANANGTCMAAVPNFVSAVTATDNCTASGSLVITQSPTAGTMVTTGVTTVTITVTDAAGNSSTCTRTFTVSDATAPTITSCGNNLTANANGSCMAAVPNFVSAVTATDNCTATGSLVITQSPTAGTMVGLGVTTVTITVTDAAGNSSTCTRTFTVSDATAPTITSCGNNLTANANGTCMAAVPNFVSAVTATDNCTASGSLVITQSPTAGTMVTTGVTTVTITVTDAAGNSSTCTRTFTVSDATAPTITSCGSNLTANANGTCMAAVPNFVSAVTATDNCTANGSLVITQSPTAGTMVTTGVTTVTITVTDAAGNSSTCTRTFTVSDVIAPIITVCPPAQSATTGSVNCNVAVPNFIGGVVATDNCTAVGSLVITQSPTAGTLVGPGVTTVTITVRDAANNATTCTTTFTVTDNVAPVITVCPTNQSANAGANCTAPVPNFATITQATDVCTAAGSLIKTQVPAAGTPVGLGVTTVTITVTDAAGNSTTCTRSFTVADNTPPTITCPATITTPDDGCGTAAIAITAPPASDNCSAVTVTGVRSDNLALTAPFAIGTTTIIWTAKDAANNTTSCTQTIVVTKALGTIIANYSFLGFTAYPFNANETAPGIASSATSSEPFAYTGSGTPTGPGAFKVNAGTNEALVLQPSSGNNTRYVTFAVSGSTLQYYSQFKVYFQAERQPQGATTLTLAYSLDGTTYTNVGSPLQLTSQTTWYEGIYDLSSIAALNTFNLSSIYFRIYASGSNANGSSDATRLEIDNFQVFAAGVGPTISCPADITVDATTAQCTATLNPGVATGQGRCGLPTITSTRSDGKALGEPYPAGVTTIEWKAADENGVFATCVQSITVRCTLPASGLVLKGNRNGSDVHLNWQTLTEQNTSYFILERSFDGIRFEPVPVGSRVPAAGNSNALRNYNLVDKNVLSQVVYYRVKLYDNNGSMKLSNLVAITLNLSKNLRVFPNPVRDYVTIEFGENGTYQIDLISDNGQLITLQKEVNVTNSFRTMTMQRNNLVSGQYQMRIWNKTTGSVNTFRLVYLPKNP